MSVSQIDVCYGIVDDDDLMKQHTDVRGSQGAATLKPEYRLHDSDKSYKRSYAEAVISRKALRSLEI
jgi:hypothetical protein